MDAGAATKVLTRAAATALFTVACLLSGAALLLLAARLQIPGLGAGAAPLDVFKVVALIALASIGTPVHLGDAQVSAMPLGLLVFVGVALWRTARTEETLGRAAELGAAVLVGPVTAGLAAAGALTARVTFAGASVESRPLTAAAAGLVWGTVSGAVAAAARARSRSEGPRPASPGLREAVTLTTGTLVLSALLALSAFAVAYIRSRGLAFPSVLGAAINALMFLPNLAGATLTLGLGAEVRAGAGLAGATQGYSLFDWAGGPAPLYAFLAVVPLLAGPLWVRKRMSLGQGGLRRRATTCAATASAIWIVAMMSSSRLGLDPDDGAGVVAIAPDAGRAFWHALVWAAVMALIPYVYRRGD